ncbi:MAG TPA: TIGR03619 family F420-dependent LLM class oxidoreductase [Candidatus Limnocylindrales bacterium]|nr:TIGR03619 family F420-dependent LLM class oxidoreductase [Candidatus Limnocylindrales bacterium]
MTGSPLRLTVRLPHSRCFASRDAIIRVAEAAEELGYWGVTVEDHFLLPRQPCATADPVDGRTVFEALATLAFVAARTERLKLITGVLVVPMRHPIMLAKETATLDALSGGRLVLGIGVGALRRRTTAENVNLVSNARIATREFDALAIHGDRGPLTDEYLAAVRELWQADPASFDGRHVSFSGLDLYPRPVQARIPIWVGGRSDKALRRAARNDGWFPSQCSAEFLASGRRSIERYAREDGTAPPSEFGPSNAACVLPSESAARDAMERLYGYYFTTREALWSQTITGSPETVARRLAEYRAAGATFADLRFLPISIESILEQMRLVAERVVPALAEGVEPSAAVSADRRTPG